MGDGWEGMDAALLRFGLPARAGDREAILAALEEQLALEASQRGDHVLMRVLCAQLFSLGRVEDSLIIWRAKSSSFDAQCGIDVQLLCGGGLAPTRDFLRRDGSDAALAALDYLSQCEAAGDFADFSPEQELKEARRYYKSL